TATYPRPNEAQSRAELISNVHYAVELDLSAGEDMQREQFPSRTAIDFRSGAGSTFVDFRAREVNSVHLDGEDITERAIGTGDYDATAGSGLSDLAAGEHQQVVEAQGDYSVTGDGLHRLQDPPGGNIYLCSQFETADAKRVFACFDQPDIKATYSLSVRTPQPWRVVTNNVVSAEAEGDTVLHRAEVDYLLSTYL